MADPWESIQIPAPRCGCHSVRPFRLSQVRFGLCTDSRRGTRKTLAMASDGCAGLMHPCGSGRGPYNPLLETSWRATDVRGAVATASWSMTRAARSARRLHRRPPGAQERLPSARRLDLRGRIPAMAPLATLHRQKRRKCLTELTKSTQNQML